jgi:hypothetical protein
MSDICCFWDLGRGGIIRWTKGRVRKEILEKGRMEGRR